MAEQVTVEYEVSRATVYYPDGETEKIKFVEGHEGNNLFRAFELDEDGWTASYSKWSEEPRLHYSTDPASEKLFTIDNFRKIEMDWIDEKVAVAEVEVYAERTGLFGVERKVDPEEPDVTIYEKHEWEAINDDE